MFFFKINLKNSSSGLAQISNLTLKRTVENVEVKFNLQIFD